MRGLKLRGGGAALLAVCLASGSAQAATISVSLGESSEDLTLYGLGPVAPGIGSFAIEQGAGSFDGTMSTFVFSGAILGGTPGYDSGTYSFVTTYDGAATPMGGPNAPTGQSNPVNLNFFFYSSFDASTTMTLNLFTPNGTVSHDLVANGLFTAGSNWSFTFVSPSCTGVPQCIQNEVGLTPGATKSGAVTISAAFEIPDAPVPEPASWAMMIAGMALTGGAMRHRRKTVLNAA